MLNIDLIRKELSLFRVVTTENSLNSLSNRKPRFDLKKLFHSDKSISNLNETKLKKFKTQKFTSSCIKLSLDFDSCTRVTRKSKTEKILKFKLPLIEENNKRVNKHNELILSKINNQFGLGHKKSLSFKKPLCTGVNFMDKTDFYFN
jgi:hypothetical protein